MRLFIISGVDDAGGLSFIAPNTETAARKAQEIADTLVIDVELREAIEASHAGEYRVGIYAHDRGNL